MGIEDRFSDEELVQQVQEGFEEAFAELVRRHTDYLYRVVWRTCPDRATAEDIVQDVFLKFWQKPINFDAGKGVKFKTWLTRVALNRAIDIGRRKKPVLDYDYLMQQSLDDPNIPLHDLEKKVQTMELEDAIQSLPERQKTALNLCYYEEMKNKEAAIAMEITDKAVEALLARAKKGLFEILSKKRREAA